MKPLAHLKTDNAGNFIIHSLEDHSRAVAACAAERLRSIGLYHVGFLAGLIHDMGKATDAFETYIIKAAHGETVVRGSVNHTFAAVIYLWETFHGGSPMEKLLCEIICTAVGSHHGLFDCLKLEGADKGKFQSGFLHRLEKDRDGMQYDMARDTFLTYCASAEEIADCFSKGVDELWKLSDQYELSMLTRMLTSAIIDGDRADTAAFFDVERETECDIEAVWEKALAHLEAEIANFNSDSAINKARGSISKQCRDFAAMPNGIYRLTVPTGAGKTLSSLRYALTNAKNTQKKHIYYIAPLLAIIEQNADEIRKRTGDPSIVLEHHSNIIKNDMTEDELGRYELAAENWDSPIIVTTLVQFLNTLFSGDTTCIRRMSALCDSVIIIDEIQSLPLKTVSLFNKALNFLASRCNCSIILCSATQPCFERTGRPVKLGTPADIIPRTEEFWKPFKRTLPIDKCTPGGYTADQTAKLILDKLKSCDSVLFICNTRKSASGVYRCLLDIIDEDDFILLKHLSASMCPAHRRETLSEIMECLGKRKVICVSTQLIEAGVDISFKCVIRVLSGLDSIAQAAGRCNRHGESNIPCEVIIIRYAEENLSHLKEIRQAQDAASTVLDCYANDPKALGNSILSDECVSAFYSQLFLQPDVNDKFDYPVAEYDTTLYDMLTKNQSGLQYCDRAELDKTKQIMCQAFAEAGRQFSVFDESGKTVIVPYNDEAGKIINDLCSERAKYDIAYIKTLLTAAKPYTVTLYDYAYDALRDIGGLIEINEASTAFIVNGYYYMNTGLDSVKRNELGFIST